MKHIALSLSTAILLQGCIVLENKPCEDLLEVKRQINACEKLRKQMNDKQHPQIALTAKQRYQEACVDLRYYRDEYDTICHADQKPIGKK